MLQIKIPDSRVVKSTVKAILKNRRIAAGVAGIIPLFIYLVLISLYGVFATLFIGQPIIAVCIASVMGLFLFLPVLLGALRFFWRMAEGLDEPVNDVFYYFTSRFLYKRAMKSILFLIFKCAAGMFLCMLPYLIVTVLSNSWIYRFLGTEIPLWVAGLALVQAFLRLVGIIIGIVVISRYYLFAALVVMDDKMLLLEAMHASVTVSKRSAVHFISLGVSLFGLMILSLFLLPVFYTAPVFFTAYAVHARFAIVNYNQNVDRKRTEQYTF